MRGAVIGAGIERNAAFLQPGQLAHEVLAAGDLHGDVIQRWRAAGGGSVQQIGPLDQGDIVMAVLTVRFTAVKAHVRRALAVQRADQVKTQDFRPESVRARHVPHVQNHVVEPDGRYRAGRSIAIAHIGLRLPRLAV